MSVRLACAANGFRAAAFALVAASAFAAPQPSAASEFCPKGYSLWGAICMSHANGDVVWPNTSGPSYEQLKAKLKGSRLCMAWDIHIRTQIEDFGTMATLPSERLARAGLMQAEALTLCREGRHQEAALVFESIFPTIESE